MDASRPSDLAEELDEEEVPVLRLEVGDDGQPEALDDGRGRDPEVGDGAVAALAVLDRAPPRLLLGLVARDHAGEREREEHLGFGRIVTSEKEPPNMLANLV